MSFAAVDAVVAASFDRDRFTNAEFRLLVVLARHHNRRSGRCDPGLRLLADETGFSKAYVVKLVQALESRGELAADRASKGGKGNRTNYSFLLGKGHPGVTLSEGSKGHWGTPKGSLLKPLTSASAAQQGKEPG